MAEESATYVLHSPLAPAQVAEALRATMLDERECKRSGTKGEFIGIVYANKFRIYRSPGLFDDYAGDFDATLSYELAGTRIQGRFVKPEYRLVFALLLRRRTTFDVKLSFCLIAASFLGILAKSIIDPQVHLLNLPMIIVTVFLLLSALEFSLMFLRRHRGRLSILRHLEKVLHATLDPGNERGSLVRS
jgi:hypothetical protein